jgi:hypothetical protein
MNTSDTKTNEGCPANRVKNVTVTQRGRPCLGLRTVMRELSQESMKPNVSGRRYFVIGSSGAGVAGRNSYYLATEPSSAGS